MIAVVLGAALVVLAAQDNGPVRPAPERSPRVSPSAPRPGARAAAEEYLRHIYAVYLSIRGCSEASAARGKPELLPSVPLDEVRRAMRQIDLAAKEVGLDVEALWAEISPVGLITAEALKADTPANLENCARLGGVFRVDLGNLQNALNALGSSRVVIEKDF